MKWVVTSRPKWQCRLSGTAQYGTVGFQNCLKTAQGKCSSERPVPGEERPTSTRPYIIFKVEHYHKTTLHMNIHSEYQCVC